MAARKPVPAGPRALASDPPALLASSGFLLARLGSESRRRFSRALATHGLRPAHYAVLMVLSQAGPSSQQRLAGMIGVDPRNAVAVLDHLQAASLIARVRDERDRRRHAVTLTPAGERFLDQFRGEGEDLEAEMLAPLSPAERASLHRLLLKLMATIGKEGPGSLAK